MHGVVDSRISVHMCRDSGTFGKVRGFSTSLETSPSTKGRRSRELGTLFVNQDERRDAKRVTTGREDSPAIALWLFRRQSGAGRESGRFASVEIGDGEVEVDMDGISPRPRRGLESSTRCIVSQRLSVGSSRSHRLKGDLLLEQRRIEQRQFVRVGQFSDTAPVWKSLHIDSFMSLVIAFLPRRGDIARARLEMAM